MNENSALKHLPEIIKLMRREIPDRAVVWDKSPFRVLIATVLSQRTRDANTKKAAEKLFAKYSTPEQIANAKQGELEKLIRASGFYKVKAQRIKQISRQLLERFGGKVPQTKEELMHLGGVGAKTANCVLVYAFGVPALPVDTHVHRISNRIGFVSTKTPEQTEAALEKTIPKKYWLDLNLLMVRYGQQICLPRNPKCEICKISKYCEYWARAKRN